METIWIRAGQECRLTVAEVAGGDEVHVIDYIVWVKDVYVGHMKCSPILHLWGIRLSSHVIVTQEYLDTIWAKFHSLSPHVVTEKTDV